MPNANAQIKTAINRCLSRIQEGVNDRIEECKIQIRKPDQAMRSGSTSHLDAVELLRLDVKNYFEGLIAGEKR